MFKHLIVAATTLAIMLLDASPGYTKNIYMTGSCVCRNGNNVIAGWTRTICTVSNHDGCSAAKAKCRADNGTACAGWGGLMYDAGTCDYGDRC